MLWRHTVLAVGLLLLLDSTQCAKLQHGNAANCPGTEKGDCGTTCRIAVCQALADFYRSTHNSSQPWVNNSGWNTTDSLSCKQIINRQGNNSSAAPEYCSWHGVACCNPAGPRRHEQDTPLQHCSPSWAVKALDLQVNNLNGSLENPRLMASLLQLHGCGLVKLQLQGNGLSGSMALPAWGDMRNMFYLDLAANWITGTLPDWLRKLRQLERLSLGSNQLAGTLPAWIGDDLPRLEVLNLGVNTGVNPGGLQGLSGTIPASLGKLQNLTVLNLELNAFVGVLPAGLCGPESRLRALKLRGNRLAGSIEPLMGCGELTQLDISSNNFSGPFAGPHAVGIWPQLAVLDASGNGFVGPLPQPVYELPMLEFLNLANNRFSGPIRRHIMLSTYLKEINLEGNALSGPIGDSLWMLPHLRLLDLSHNRLNGTISGMIGRTSNLEELQLGSNDLSGPLPPQLGLLKKINVVNLAANPDLGCLLPAERPGGLGFSTPDARLSAGLGSGFSPTGSGESAGSGAIKLADGMYAVPLQRAGNDPNSSSSSSSSSDESPYCRDEQLLPCFLAFANYTVPRADSSKMACPAILRRHIEEARAVCAGEGPGQLGSQAHSVADALAADEQSWKIEPGYYQYRGCRCFSGFVEVWCQGGTQLTCEPESPPSQPPWVRSLIEAVAASGAMLLAAAALLVWMRLAVALRPRWRREKELAEARRRGVPCGGPATIVVTDIEAYSELMAANAPLTTKALGVHNAILRRATCAHAGTVIEQEGDSWSVAFHSAMDAVAFCLQVQQALDKTHWPRDLGSHLTNTSTAKLSFETEGTEAAAGAGPGGGCTAAAAAAAAAAGQQPWEGSGSMAGKGGGCEAVAQGLRVRMGVASGVVPAGVNISNCSLLQLAKAVSDMAHGGQILLDARACAGVRDRLTELGAVDARGYNDMQLAHAARAAMRQQTSGLLSYCLGRFSSCLSCSLLNSRSSALDNDALLLDMGELYAPGLAPLIPAAASGSSSGTDGGAAGSSSAGVARVLAASGRGRAALAAAAGALVSGPVSSSSKAEGKAGGLAAAAAGVSLVPASLQLYSILPRPLAGRARQWGAALNFKQGSEAMARGFFDAPGTDVAELQAPALPGFSSPGGASGGPLLLGGGPLGGGSAPLAVTMVFCCVEGGAARVHRRPEVARLLHATLSRLMQALLLALPCRDGYLARQQEGELKYMLAFASPARALEWALLLQEVLLHVPWPAAVLDAFASSCSSSSHGRPEPRTSTSSSVHDGSCCSTGSSSSGRPRLNIGLAEGQPQCIGPDHLGRADYHAPFVNLAARMLAAAHGGQVVTSIELAQSIFSTWCYEAELVKCHQTMAAAPTKQAAQLPEAAGALAAAQRWAAATG
ncbi:hypothetical protein OEZ86_009450 [Tetradesmus obliquus]|nr:hypothetical protein OEZ86_009450 [Tetradesmus obliquus]